MIVGSPFLNAGLAHRDLGNQKQQIMELHSAAKLKHKAAKGRCMETWKTFSKN